MPEPSPADPVQFVKGIGPGRAAALERLGIRSAGALLYHLPRAYLDRGAVRPVRSVRAGELVMLQGTVESVVVPRRGMLTAVLEDASGRIELVWFHAPPFLGKRIFPGAALLVTGTVQIRRRPQIPHPEVESLDESSDPAAILPCYPLTEGLTNRVLRAALPPAVARYAPLLKDTLEEVLRTRHGLLPLDEALRAVHAPRTLAEAEAGRRRLAYEECLALQRVMAKRRQGVHREEAVALPVDDALHARILQRLPFRPTAAQARAFEEVRADLAQAHPMNRMLQGDVGSGKTAVAAYAMLAAVAHQGQAALLAPTEILAEQHGRTLGAWLQGSRVRMALLTGGLPAKERRRMLSRLEDGNLDLIVGTHALIDGSVRFRKLALAVVDEQHKFGVLQREALAAKGPRPHLLIMTATPIPRTLMLSVFGDLDVSTLDELPPGRRAVETRIVPEEDRASAYAFVRREIESGRQAFFVAPLIDPSDRVAAKAATLLHKEVEAAFPDCRVLFLHGRLPRAGKEQVMEDFRRGRAPILVSTQVIEVGVDVPNASVMAIESAERYGLAQLHQLRGRIGRGKHASTCLLFSHAAEAEDLERLRILASTQDGFRISEEDLRLRGPGEFLGTRQHGLPELRIADLAKDLDLLIKARQDAQSFPHRPSGSPAPPSPRRRPADAGAPRPPGGS